MPFYSLNFIGYILKCITYLTLLIIYRYCSKVFTVQAYRDTYAGIVVPMEDSQYWPEVIKFLSYLC